MSELKRLNQSRVKTVLTCRKLYHFIYEEGLVSSQEKPDYLQIGSITHHLLHKYDKQELTLGDLLDVDQLVKNLYPGNTDRELSDVVSQVTSLVRGYLLYNFKDTLQILPGETILEVQTPNCILVCKPDAWARDQSGNLWRLERKTAGKMDSAYLNGLKGGLQGALYDHATEHLFDEELKGTVYDILVKTKVPGYARSFARIDRSAIKRALETLHTGSDQLDECKETGHWFRNANSCYLFNRECTHLMLCKHDTPLVRNQFYKRKEVDYEDTAPSTPLST